MQGESVGGADEHGGLGGELQRELERTRAELSSVQARLGALVNSAMDAVVCINAAQEITLFNPAAEAMFGYAAGEVLGRRLEMLMPQAMQRSHAAHVQAFGSAGATQRKMGSLGHVPARHRDGTIFPIEASISQGDTRGERQYMAIIRNISERLAQEEATRRHIGRLDLLAQITKAIAGRQDLRSVYLVVLRVLRDQFAADFGAFLSCPLPARGLEVTAALAAGSDEPPDAGFPNFVPRGQDPLGRAFAGETILVPDSQAAPAMGTAGLAAADMRCVSLIPLRIQDDVLGVMVIARRKPGSIPAEEFEFLRQVGEHVALAGRQYHIVEELGRACADLRTSQRKVMEQERLRAMGQMASGIAHDINNALAPITLYSEALLDSESGLSERGRRHLASISTSSRAIAHTVASLRQFYRSNSEEGEGRPVRINDLLQEVAEITRPRWRDIPQQRGITIALEIEAGPIPEVQGSTSELRDAFINLVFNAVDAMPLGGSLTIRTFTRGGLAVVEFRDTGLGMDAATRNRCLEPFFTTKGELGTGLGLSMVFGMVQRHEGDLDIDSAPGRGTTVRISLPPKARSTFAPSQGAALLPPSNLHILCIDDDAQVRTSLVDILLMDGHDVTAASGGAEGVAQCEAAMRAGRPYDVVISDVGMPHMDGRVVATHIKAIAPATLVILLTGWGAHMLASEENPPGVDVILGKPPRLGDLRRALAGR